jgi:hypothetical protein
MLSAARYPVNGYASSYESSSIDDLSLNEPFEILVFHPDCIYMGDGIENDLLVAIN